MLTLGGCSRTLGQTLTLAVQPDFTSITLDKEKGQYYVDTSGKLSVNHVVQQRFYSYQHYFKTGLTHLPLNQNVWIKLILESCYVQDTAIVFYCGIQNYITLYDATDGKLEKIAYGGNLMPLSRLSIIGISQAVLLPLKAYKTSTFYIEIKNQVIYHVDEFKPSLMSRPLMYEQQARVAQITRDSDISFFIFIGMFLMMFIYILIRWLFQRDITYLYYSINISSGAIFFFINHLEEGNNALSLPWAPIVNYQVSDFFLFISMYAYWQFINHFLYLGTTMHGLAKLMKIVSWCIFALGAVSIIWATWTEDIMTVVKIDSAAGFVLLAIGLYVFYRLRRIKSPLRYFVYGSISCMLFFYTLASLFEAAKDTKWEFFTGLTGSMPLIMIGHVGEMFFFTFGLAFRNRLDLKEQADTRVQIAEAEMKALRAQMNPHFIFNCMHTIDAYIFRNEPENASRFLNKFSKLVRQVLENSSFALISLKKEVDMLRLFTELELERYGNEFEVFFSFNEGVLNLNYQMPALLIQPYVENAILHGLRQKKEMKGILTIIIKEDGENLVILVSDNGVGRAAAAKNNDLHEKQHVSMALELTEQRLNALQPKGSVSIYDNVTSNTGTGTTVQLIIPKLY